MPNESNINNISEEIKRRRRISIILEPEYVIVSLVKEDKKEYLTMARLFQFIAYLRLQLSEKAELTLKYEVIFDINFTTIERTVRYHGNVFDLIGETIVIKKDRYPPIPENVEKFLPQFIKGFAREFAA